MAGRASGVWSGIMRRIVSAWLPRWPILRFLTEQSRTPCVQARIDPERPFVLTATASGGPRIAAANRAAETAGIAKGDRLADARAKALGLQIRPFDPVADRDAPLRLALWATRYTPMVAA